jgi:hypothetical protein
MEDSAYYLSCSEKSVTVFETPIYLILMTLSSWFFPQAESVAFVEQRPGQTNRVIYSVKSHGGPQRLTYYGLSSAHSKEMLVMGRYTLDQANLKWQFGEGKRATHTTSSLERTILGFATLKAVGITSMSLVAGGELTVRRTDGAVELKAEDGTIYHFFADHIPAQYVVNSPGPIVPYRPMTASMKGWLLYGAPLSVTRGDSVQKRTIDRQDAGGVALGFLSGLMNGDGGYEPYLAKDIPSDIREAFKTHGDVLGKGILKYKIHGFVDQKAIGATNPVQQSLLRRIDNAIGPVDRIFFLEINGPANDGFLALTRGPDGYSVRGLISKWGERLFPKKYQEAMGGAQ